MSHFCLNNVSTSNVNFDVISRNHSNSLTRIFFSSNSGVNEEQFRLKIDLKNKQTNKNGERFLGKEGVKRGVVKIAVSILNLFSMLEVRENLKSEELTI